MTKTAEISREDSVETKPQLPDGWRREQLGNVCDIRMGETLIAKDLTGDGIPVFSANTSVEPWVFTSHGRLKFNQSSVVVGARGSIGFPRWPNLPAWTATQTTIVLTCRDSEALIPEWLLRALQRVDFKGMTAQQAIPMMTVGDLELFEIPLPPPTEQKRIAGILKEQMAAVERACRSAEAQLQAAEALPAALLRRAFNGEL
jgi:type I restriction enzyme S subunit